MNNLIKSLKNIKDDYLLIKYRDVCNEANPIMDLEVEVLSYIIKYKDTFKVYPSVADIIGKFTNLSNTGVEIPEIDKFLLERIAEVTDKNIRKALISTASGVNISVEKIQKVLNKFPQATNLEVKDHTQIDGKEIYSKITEKSVGMKLFVDAIDDQIGGTSYGTIMTIFGFVGNCKTTLAQSASYKNAAQLGYNQAFVTLETPKNKVYFNFLARHALEMKPDTKVTAKMINKGLLTDEERDWIFNEVEPSFKQTPGKIFILDIGDIAESSSSIVSPNSFKAALVGCHKQCKGGLDGVIVDYINNMKFFKAGNDEYGPDAFMGFLDMLAKDFEGTKLIVWVLCQANREGYKKACKKNGTYEITALAEFNQVERSSSYIVPVFLDDVLRSSGEIKMQLIKNRDGALIQEPITTLCMPENFFIGDSSEYKQVYTEEALEGLLDGN